MTAMLHAADLDRPVPYTLTPRGYAVLALDRPRPVEAVPLVDEPGPADEWSCDYCGAAFFGPCPDDGLCETCRAADLEPVCTGCGRGDCECWKLDSTGPAVTREIPAYEWEW
jgi:hypothetical protein